MQPWLNIHTRSLHTTRSNPDSTVIRSRLPSLHVRRRQDETKSYPRHHYASITGDVSRHMSRTAIVQQPTVTTTKRKVAQKDAEMPTWYSCQHMDYFRDPTFAPYVRHRSGTGTVRLLQPKSSTVPFGKGQVDVRESALLVSTV